jgi:predicted enzyme related to lactoylglutathione lyase
MEVEGPTDLFPSIRVIRGPAPHPFLRSRFAPRHSRFRMKFEHFALNVPDCAKQAQWYVQHVGFKVARKRDDAPFTHFLADETGRIVLEFYSNPKAAYPDYAKQHPLCFHFAVVAADAKAEQARLEKAGATIFLEEPQPDGTLLIMLRDPWGVPLQLCQRTTPFPMP